MWRLFFLVYVMGHSHLLSADDAQHAKEHNSQPEMQLDEVKSIASAKTATFISPEGWRFADSNMLPKHVKTMVVGKGEHEMPPSINLGYEEFNGTLKDYLKIVKKINESQGDKWSDLGTIETKAGPASLSQVDIKTEWGALRQMHVIYLDQGVVYILTAAALKDEFPKFYPIFFQALRSFNIN